MYSLRAHEGMTATGEANSPPMADLECGIESMGSSVATSTTKLVNKAKATGTDAKHAICLAALWAMLRMLLPQFFLNLVSRSGPIFTRLDAAVDATAADAAAAAPPPAAAADDDNEDDDDDDDDDETNDDDTNDANERSNDLVFLLNLL